MRFTTKRSLNINEVKEIMRLMYLQETNDKYTNTKLLINGEFAIIEVVIDEEGNITIL